MESKSISPASISVVPVGQHHSIGLLKPVPEGLQPAGSCSRAQIPQPPSVTSVYVDSPSIPMEPKVPTSVLVIYNPFSGNGRAQASLDAIRAPLERANIRIEVAPTQFPRHAFEMARDRDFSAFDCLMICGGDGTFHEVLNGLMNRPQGLTNTPPVAIIPGGTGNSCAVSMGIDDPAVAVQAVIQGKLRKMDIGRVTFGDDRVIYLFNLLGWGLAADATATAEECRCLGTLRYDFGAVWQIILGSKRSVRMDIDGEVYEGDYCLVLVQNNQHGGSRLRFAPFAKMDDGCLDVVIARNDGRMATISLFDEVKRDGCHVYEESVVYRRFKRMTLSTPQPTLVNIDGEGGFVTPLTVECVPSAISMYAAPLRL